jgi:geranylgeranyl pyrophosphate synthase
MDSLARHLGQLTEPAERAGHGTSQLLDHAVAFLAHDLAALHERLQAWVAAGTAPGSLAASHLLQAGGKRIRPLLLLLSYRGFAHTQRQVLAGARTATSETVARDLAAVAELVHMATLMHDDVVDDAADRRGVPVARRLWGNAVSVLAGDLLLVRSLEAARGADESIYIQ